MKKFIVTLMITAMAAASLIGCGFGSSSGSDSSKTDAGSNGSAGVSGLISVVSREDGSGTRGAFIELFGIEEKDADGNKVDRTTEEAIIANSTEFVLSNVSGDPNAIGYVSLGALSGSVKALKINGVEATAENIKNGTYEISRPFNIATSGTPREVTQDFINYILSTEGQAVVEGKGYIQAVEAPKAFESSNASGKIVISGSTSVSPVMEKLIEAYKKVNSNAAIELQTSDSSKGLQDVMDGTADIGMASRELKKSEASLSTAVIAIDGIAVVVNQKNAIDSFTKDEVKAIFTGETITW